jgi:hypothetical protein
MAKKAQKEKTEIVGKCADCFYARMISGVQKCRDIEPYHPAYIPPDPAECGRHITHEEMAKKKADVAAKKVAEEKAKKAAEEAAKKKAGMAQK